MTMNMEVIIFIALSLTWEPVRKLDLGLSFMDHQIIINTGYYQLMVEYRL